MFAMSSTSGHVHIGTSGWHYKHWRGPFYPQDLPPPKMLAWYADRFDTVEINNSFYRLPSSEALAGWRRQTPPNFCFAVKASRYITHNRKLKDGAETTDKFISQVRELGKRLGPVLFQLPPSWRVNVERLEGFLSELPGTHRYVFEFRNETWNTPEVYAVLCRHNAALCIFELAGFQSPLEVTADFAYVRLHGPGNKYQGDYSQAQLRTWTKRIEAWRNALKHIFIYFDNDQAGFAAKNAMELKRMVFGSQVSA
jgi:uncharacterized protein YecE (DUF72 family)